MAKKKKLRVLMTRQEEALGWIWLAFQQLLLPVLLRMLNSLLPAPLSAAYLNFIYFSLNCGFILGFFHSFLGKSLTAAGKSFWEFLQAVVLGFVGCQVEPSPPQSRTRLHLRNGFEAAQGIPLAVIFFSSFISFLHSFIQQTLLAHFEPGSD